MRGIIVLDGPDCAGKTTLAEELKRQVIARGSSLPKKHQFAAEVHHLSLPVKGQAFEEHKVALIAYIKKAWHEGKVIIADRHFLSEAIYGAHYRGGSEYPETARYMDMLLHRFKALRVICCPPVEQVVKIHAEMKQVRVEMYNKGMDRIAQRFLNLWHGDESREDVGKIPDYVEQLSLAGGVKDIAGWYLYDYTKNDLKEYAAFLLDELRAEYDLMPDGIDNIDRWGFTGFPSQHAVLFVGDKMNSDNELRVPFLANSASSLYLAKTFHALNLEADKTCIANINDKGGVETVKMLSELCGRVVVMGREAQRTMDQYGLRYDFKIDHPQYANRFNHYNNRYVEQMTLALKE